jgi:hypothetical protein
MAFSFTSICSRAASHSFADTTGGVFMIGASSTAGLATEYRENGRDGDLY